MLRLDAFVPPALADDVSSTLISLPGLRHVTVGVPTADGAIALSAEIDAASADAVIERLASFGIASNDLTLWRVPGIRPLGWHRRTRSDESDVQVWAQIVGRADENAKLASTYLVFMASAGIIAGIGVLTGSAVLLVGAMAISPDLLPISATAIGVLGAFAATAVLRLFNRVPDDLRLADTAMGEALTELGPGSLIVAAVAGVAGMMAFERPGGAAVGVAISVTTIPAAAYVGTAMAMGRDDPMWGALAVLITNVFILVIASTTTLEVQRRSRQRRTARALERAVT